jgi:hypothetical protein
MSKKKLKKEARDMSADDVIRKVFSGKILRAVKRITSEKKRK